jgi:hypothetical protein
VSRCIARWPQPRHRDCQSGEWRRDERKAFQIASALGGGTRLSLEVLRELRLILRFMRRNGMNAEFYESIAALCDRAITIAAE